MADEKVTTNTKEGKVNVLGMDFQISDLVGDQIVAKWIAQLSEEDMQLIYDGIDKILFDVDEHKSYNYETHEYEKHPEKFLSIEREVKDNTWSSSTHKEYKPLYTIVSERIRDQMCTDIMKRTEEIINSEAYKEKVENIANNIIDDITTGYYEAVKEGIMHKLVGDTLLPGDSQYQRYFGMPLSVLIQDEIQKMIH